MQYDLYDPKKHSHKEFKNPLDGSYFKYKKHNTQPKKLQVFSQMIHVGGNKMLMATVRDMSTWLELEKMKNVNTMKTVAFA